MSQATPTLTPRFCFDQTALRDFLRISRSSIDDTITQNLNALLTPANTSFDPTTTSSRSTIKRTIEPQVCNDFRDKILFPSWQARDHVLHYCAGVATSPDPNDPQNLLRQVSDERARQRVVNERLDPYSGRYFPQDTRTEALAALLRNENMIEDIIRRRTRQIVSERCPGSGDFDAAHEEWRTRQ